LPVFSPASRRAMRLTVARYFAECSAMIIAAPQRTRWVLFFGCAVGRYDVIAVAPFHFGA
jgi:hypothetical protein